MKKLLSLIIVLIITVLSFLALESALALMCKLTHGSKFNLFESVESYPKNTESYIKIAMFGGSAGNGYNSEMPPQTILRYELESRFPERKFYIRNYAGNGQPFHRHQAEILKDIIDKYDYFLVYCGNNEPANYLDDIGYFRSAKYKRLKALKPYRRGDIFRSFYSFLKSHSRSYAVILRAFRKAMDKYEKSPGRVKNIYAIRTFKEFEPARVLPDSEIEMIYTNFREDLEEIAALAAKYEKDVIISSLPIYETWKPFFSVVNTSLNDKEKVAFKKNYELGLECYKRKQFKEALSYFLSAHKIDDSVAILNYYIGFTYLAVGDRKEAHEFFVRSSDYDGFPSRALSPLRKIKKEIASEHKNMHFVDTFDTFCSLFDQGVPYQALFSDLQHPSLLGHAVIVNNFLSKILEIESAKSGFRYSNDFNINSDNYSSLLSYYKKALYVSDKVESQNAFMIARWQASLAGLSAYPDDFLDVAEIYLNKFYEKSDKTSTDKADMLLFEALIECERKKGNYQTAIKRTNEAQGLLSGHTEDFLYKKVATGETIVDRFNKAGIFYSKEDKRFYFKK